MNYWEDDKHRIQADMAFRIGKIALQYARILLPPKENYSDSLNLCLLQNLLTNCKELMNAMSLDNGDELGLKVSLSDMPDWGLGSVELREDSFEGSLTVEVFLTHLRNAMSHPTGTNLDAQFPSTGYNSIPETSGLIGAIGFCNSPDTKDNKPRFWKDREKANAWLRQNQKPSVMTPWAVIPHDVSIESFGYNRFGLFRFGEPYARLFVTILTTGQLRSLVLGLSNLLAQPALKYWDGKSVTNLFAA